MKNNNNNNDIKILFLCRQPGVIKIWQICATIFESLESVNIDRCLPMTDDHGYRIGEDCASYVQDKGLVISSVSYALWA